MKLMYQVPGYVSNSGFCFIYLFVYLFCLSVYLFAYLFSFHFILFIPIYFILIHPSILISFCLSILFYFFSFSFSIQKSRKRRRQPNHTKPHLPTYVLNFPSFVCVYKEAQAGQKKTLSSRPELLQKSGNVLVLCMQQRSTVRRTGRGGISCGLRTPKYTYLPYIVGFALGKAWSASRPTFNEDSMWTSTCTLTLHVLRDGPFCSGKKACCHT